MMFHAMGIRRSDFKLAAIVAMAWVVITGGGSGIGRGARKKTELMDANGSTYTSIYA